MDIGSTFGQAVIAASVAVGLGIAMSRQKKQNVALAPAIEAHLKAHGPTTLPVLSEALGLGGFFRRGKVVLALNDLVIAGKIEMSPAPEGTPQLEKVNHIRYRWREV